MNRIPMKRALLTGLGLMAVTAVAAAISPAVAEFVATLLVMLVVLVAMVPATVAGRRLWLTMADRRAERVLAPAEDVPAREPVPQAPAPVGLAELRSAA
ncbi:MAG: hypothetical protein L0I76_17425 [Pseudonocardia sp.]|nr:hypothetical protein [Pseudonocardia sp.]